MECHDIRLLLAFAQRPSEQLDAVEREAIAQHLHICPDCAALAQSERHVDELLGQVMRDVPVPGDLKQRVMKRLTAQPRRVPWPRLAAAAVLLLAIAGVAAWQVWPAPEVKVDDLIRLVPLGNQSAESVEEQLAEQGLPVKVPRDFDYQFLQHVDVVEFKGRRVAKLTFASVGNGGTAIAHVLILSPRQFRTDDLPAGTTPGATSVRIQHKDDFTYVIYSRGDLKVLLLEQI